MKSIANMMPAAERATRTVNCADHGPYESINWLGSVWSKCAACTREAEAKVKAAEEAKLREAQLKVEKIVLGPDGPKGLERADDL